MPPRKKREGDDVTSSLATVVPANTKFTHDPDTGKAICGALNRAGGLCKRPPMPNGKCNLHGGKSLKGPASPNFKHGRYSKYVPAKLGMMIDDMASDPNRLDQTAQMGILDAMLVETLKEFEVGGGASSWLELSKLKQDYDRAGARKDVATQVYVVREVWRLVDSATAKWMASKEAREIIMDRRKLTESERKRLVEEKQMIPLDQVALALSRIGKAILANVPDDRSRQAIYNEVIAILGSFTTNQKAYYGGNYPGDE